MAVDPPELDEPGSVSGAPDAGQVRSHLRWLAHGPAGGCTQLELRRAGKTVRSFHDDAESILEAVRANPEHAVNVGVNPRPAAWAGDGYRDCPAEAIETLTALRLDIDACRPLDMVTAEGIQHELDTDNRQRIEHDKHPFEFPPAAVRSAARCAGRIPGLLSGRDADKAKLREAIQAACSRLDLELRAEVLSKLVTCADRAAAGQPTTDDEHELAVGAGKRVAAWAEAQGWGAPLVVDSGNGCHIWLAVAPTEITPANREALQLGCAALERLVRAEVESEYPTLRVDPWGGFAATTRLAGCWNRKGTHTAERPHRMARIVQGAERGTGKALAAWLLSEGEATRQQRADDLAKRKAEAEERAKQYGGMDGTEPINFAERAERAIEEQLSKRPLAGAGHNETLAAMLPLAGLLVRLGMPERLAALVREAEPTHWTPRQLEIEIGKALDKARSSNEFGSFKTDMLSADAERAQERAQQRTRGEQGKTMQHTDSDFDFGPTEYPELGGPDDQDEPSRILQLVPSPSKQAGEQAPGKPQAKRRWEMLGAAELVQLSREFLDRLEDGREAPIPTGHAQLDDQLDGGLWPGLHVWCGPTGSLKTQMALTSAINAARAGTPVVVIALEQRRGAWATRVQAELSGTSWSRAIRNQMSAEEKSKCLATEWPASLSLVPGEPYAFPIDCVVEIAAEMRKRHPTGQALIVVDYCQLQGDINLSDETRQRVMRAALAAQRAAHKYDLSILLLSSVAREHYAKLADLPCKPSMLVTRDTERGPVRELKSAHALIGLGKEAGELEFSAESVTIIAKGQHADIPGAAVVVAATAKRRCGDPSWCAFRAERGRLYAAPDYRLRAGADGVDAAEAGVNREARLAACDKLILDALAEHPGGLSKNGVRGEVKGYSNDTIDQRLAVLDEIEGKVRIIKRLGRGGGSTYQLVDPEYRKQHEAAKAALPKAGHAHAASGSAAEQAELAWIDD